MKKTSKSIFMVCLLGFTMATSSGLMSQTQCGPSQTQVIAKCYDASDWSEQQSPAYYYYKRVCDVSKCGYVYIADPLTTQECRYCNDNEQQ
jgi:hypothetical protein